MEKQSLTYHVCDNCGGVGTNRCGGCGAAHYCGRDCQSRHWKNGHKNVCAGRQPKKPTACGLCGNKFGPFVKTPCCGRVVCDTEGDYQMFSYERVGQCARNHRNHSVCGFHYNESHRGDWKDCAKCEEYFHPFDYAVKAVSQARSGTIYKYNFDDNVRTDLDPASIPMPQCFECTNRVNTTEENNRTIMMRKLFHSPVLCEEHGSVYGHRIYGAERMGCGEK